MQRPSSKGEDVSRREFEAVIEPIREGIKDIHHEMERIEQRIATSDEVKRVENLLNVAVGQWHQSNVIFTTQQHTIEKKVAFAQGAVAILAFLIGTGSLAGFLYFILQR